MVGCRLRKPARSVRHGRPCGRAIGWDGQHCRVADGGRADGRCAVASRRTSRGGRADRRVTLSRPLFPSCSAPVRVEPPCGPAPQSTRAGCAPRGSVGAVLPATPSPSKTRHCSPSWDATRPHNPGRRSVVSRVRPLRSWRSVCAAGLRRPLTPPGAWRVEPCPDGPRDRISRLTSRPGARRKNDSSRELSGDFWALVDL